MSAAAKIRLGAAILIAGEILGLLTQARPWATTFVGFIVGAGGLIVVGAALGTWGVIQHGERS